MFQYDFVFEVTQMSLWGLVFIWPNFINNTVPPDNPNSRPTKFTGKEYGCCYVDFFKLAQPTLHMSN